MINKITIKNKVKIVNNEYVIKKKTPNINNIYNYLLSRSFNYMPKILKEDEENIYYEYIDDIEEPLEQKIIDLINLISLLHNKTTFYREIDLDYYKFRYENIIKRINEVSMFYNNLMEKIDSEVYMSPYHYLIARNISLINNILKHSKIYIDNWYKSIENSRKERVVLIHGNLSIDHYLKRDKSYLISFDKAEIGSPVTDLVNLYKTHSLNYDFISLLKIYLSKYPLSNSEMLLFLSIISIPDIVIDEHSEYKKVLKARRIIDYIYKTNHLLTEYGIKKQPDKN